MLNEFDTDSPVNMSSESFFFSRQSYLKRHLITSARIHVLLFYFVNRDRSYMLDNVDRNYKLDSCFLKSNWSNPSREIFHELSKHSDSLFSLLLKSFVVQF